MKTFNIFKKRMEYFCLISLGFMFMYGFGFNELDYYLLKLSEYHTYVMSNEPSYYSFLLCFTILILVFVYKNFKDLISYGFMLSISSVTYFLLQRYTPESIREIVLFCFLASIVFTFVLVLVKSVIYRKHMLSLLIQVIEMVVFSYLIADVTSFLKVLFGFLRISLLNLKFFLDPILMFFVIISLIMLNCQTIRGFIFYLVRRKELCFREIITDEQLPKVGVVIAAYNEEHCIVDTVVSVLDSDYPKEKIEVFVVSDGSVDNTSQVLKQNFNMVCCVKNKNSNLCSNKLKEVFKSKDSNLFLIEKDNGGKHDALNLGINYLSKDTEWVVVIDADCVVDTNGIRTLATETLFKKDLVAINGSILGQKNDSLISRIQQFEYIVAFFLNRASLSIINSMMIVSGAFGMFKKDKLLKVGGYKEGLGEDMGLTLDLHSEHKNNIVAFVPEAVLYTQFPFSYSDLRSQRMRWYKGLIESLLGYSFVLLNPKMIIGYLEFFVLEFLGPILFPVGVLIVLAIPEMIVNPIFIVSTILFMTSSFIQTCSSLYIYSKKYKKELHLKYWHLLCQIPLFLFSLAWRTDALLDYHSKDWGFLNRVQK